MINKKTIKQEKEVLIPGASIAGTTLAFRLQKDGYFIRLIERSRYSEQVVKNPGQKVLKLIGLEEKIEAMNTREKGAQLLNDPGKVIKVLRVLLPVLMRF